MQPPIVLGLILGTIAEQGYVQTILGGMAMDVPQLRLLENTLSQTPDCADSGRSFGLDGLAQNAYGNRSKLSCICV